MVKLTIIMSVLEFCTLEKKIKESYVCIIHTILCVSIILILKSKRADYLSMLCWEEDGWMLSKIAKLQYSN